MKDVYVERRNRIKAFQFGYNINAQSVIDAGHWLQQFGYQVDAFSVSGNLLELVISNHGSNQQEICICGRCFLAFEDGKFYAHTANDFLDKWEPEN